MVIKLDLRKILQGRPRMLTRDLSAVANLQRLIMSLSAYVFVLIDKSGWQISPINIFVSPRKNIVGRQIGWSSFSRVTLCASARSLLSPGVRPSVCLSVTLVHCIHTAEDIVKLLPRPGSPIILVFLTHSAHTHSKGNPFNGGEKFTRMEYFAIFNWNRRLSRKRCEISPWLDWKWKVNRKS